MIDIGSRMSVHSIARQLLETIQLLIGVQWPKQTTRTSLIVTSVDITCFKRYSAAVTSNVAAAPRRASHGHTASTAAIAAARGA